MKKTAKKEKKFVDMELDLPEDLLWKLFMIAHERDITLNKLMNELFCQFFKEECAGLTKKEFKKKFSS